MAEEPFDFMREYLRRMDEKLDRVLIRMDELSSNISGLLQIAAAQSSHFNRLDQRVERIEKRLNLVDA
jgi:archaellum component FlaC